MEDTYIEGVYATYKLEKDYILGIFKNIAIDKAAAEKLIQERLEIFSNYNKYILIMDVRNVKSIDKEARELLASEEGTRFIKAGALIIDSTVSKVMGNFFLTINKPIVPTQLFTREEDAIKWLEQFK